MSHAPPPLTPFQRELVDHWVKYMPIHRDAVAHSIAEHFRLAPWDRDAMKPELEAAWRRNPPSTQSTKRGDQWS